MIALRAAPLIRGALDAVPGNNLDEERGTRRPPHCDGRVSAGLP
jgi:hypothetical protein